MNTTFAVILNAGSGPNHVDEKFRRLKDAFLAKGLNPEIFLVHKGTELSGSAQKAILKGHSLIVAAGGDGTVSTIAAEVHKAGITLGILPLGTLNHLAKDIGVPLDIDKAIEVLISGRTITIDTAQVNDKIFVNNSSIGLYTKLVLERQRYQTLGLKKWQAFFWTILNLGKQYSYLKADIEINGQKLEIKTPFVFVGNNQYEVEGANIGTRERIDSNKLTVCVARHSGKLGFLNLAFHAVFGGLVQHKDFDLYSCSSVTINTQKKFLPVALDGEILSLSTPLSYKILPKSLKVKVL